MIWNLKKHLYWSKKKPQTIKYIQLNSKLLQLSNMLPFLLFTKVSISLLMSLSSTNCYFITECKNANHHFFPKWKEMIVISLQTSSLSPCLPTSNTLTTNFFVEQSLTASMLIKHLPFSLPPKDHQIALQEPHSILRCCTFNPSVYMQVYSLSTTWEGQSVFGILILYSYSNIEAIINHSTSTNKRNKITCTNEGEKRKKLR